MHRGEPPGPPPPPGDEGGAAEDRVERFLSEVAASPERAGQVELLHTLPARAARFEGEEPDGASGRGEAEPLLDLHPRLRRHLSERGIDRLYLHQARAARLALGGKNVVVVTSTASGKTLCYNLPVLDGFLREA